MSKQRVDSPDNFPWNYLYSGKEGDMDKARAICSSKETGSLTVKKAVTVINGGDQIGSKEENCEKIIKKDICNIKKNENFLKNTQCNFIQLSLNQ